MTKRKIQLTGGGTTFIVSLPKKWVKKHKIGQGDEIAILESKSGSLTLLPPSYEDSKRSSALLEKIAQRPVKKEDAIEQYITSSYIKGIKEVSISSKRKIAPADLELIRLTADKLKGYEIVRQEDRKVVIKDFLSPASINVRELMSRLYQVISQIHTASMGQIVVDKKNLTSVFSLKAEADKLAYLLRRMLLSASSDPRVGYQTKLDAKHIPLFNDLVTNLKDIGNLSVSLAEEAAKHSNKDEITQVLALHTEIKIHLNEIRRCLEEGDKVKAHTSLSDVKATKHRSRRLLKTYLEDGETHSRLAYYTSRTIDKVQKITKTVNMILIL